MFKRFFVLFAVFILVAGACTKSAPEPLLTFTESGDNSSTALGYASTTDSFKIPVPPGYDWEITQSWASHCSRCQQKYDGWDYCNLSHTAECCRYAWDFNLPLEADRGKPVLASATGNVKQINYSRTWGYFITLSHGDNICTRYAHLLRNSSDHLQEGQSVCQGLVVGNIGNTGNSEGYHLHFQFEHCDDPGISIRKSFTDGNDVPVCTRNDDVYNSHGEYSFLQLTNAVRQDCGSDSAFGGGQLPAGGWLSADCGNLPGCPLIPNCTRPAGRQFYDYYEMTTRTAEAAAYLYSECAVDGSGGFLRHAENITRAEALKIPMYLFGLMQGCGSENVPFRDIDTGAWYFSVVACALRQGLISTVSDYFRPNSTVTFGEGAKFLVESAVKANVIELQNPVRGHFLYINSSHWSYPYVETLYYYGGVTTAYLGLQPDDRLERGKYVVMAASLSPCFCRNISCENDCECDQAYFSCIDQDNTSTSTGGGDEDGGLEAPFAADGGNDLPGPVPADGGLEVPFAADGGNDLPGGTPDPVPADGGAVDPPECVPNCSGRQCGPDYCGDYCGSCAPGRSCDYNTGQCVCSPDACGGSCGECSEGYICRVGLCVCVPQCNGKQCGSDGCMGSCGLCQVGERCNASGQCAEDPCIYCPYGQCVNGQCAVDQWVCDPDVEYTLILYSPSGNFRILASGTIPLYEGLFPDDPTLSMHVTFDCTDLPIAILINGGPGGIRAATQGDDRPTIAAWVPYLGELTFSPPYNPDVTAYNFTTSRADTPVLLRIPSE